MEGFFRIHSNAHRLNSFMCPCVFDESEKGNQALLVISFPGNKCNMTPGIVTARNNPYEMI